MNKKHNAFLRPLYDDLYYRIESLFASSCYKEWLNNVSRHFERFGLPLPDKPIKRDECLSKPGPWWRKNFELYRKTNNSKEWIKAQEELESLYKQKKITGEQYKEREHIMMQSLVLFPFGDYVDFVLRECVKTELTSAERKIFYKHIIDRIFYGAKEYIAPFTISKHPVRKSGKDIWGAFIEITPTLKKEDILKNWHLIKKEQERMTGYKKNFKKRKNLRRDILIMEFYKKYNNRELQKKHLYSKIANRLEEEGYDNISFESIAKIIKVNNKDN